MKNTLWKSQVRGGEILSILMVLVLAWAAPVEARKCGGAKACACGDTVVRDHILTRSLGPCPGVGLRLTAGVTLDGNGESIQGTGNQVGVVLDEKAGGAVVRNLEVSGFKRGVRLAGVRGARLENVQSHHNGDRTTAVGYGIDLARGASENVLVGLRVFENADEGIHFGTAANRNQLRDSEVFDNYRENVYFLQNRGNEVHRSKLHGGGAAAFYVKHAPETVLTENEVRDRPIHIRGRSHGVRLRNNRLERSAVNIEPFKKDAPVGVQVIGGKITAGGTTCVRLREARDVLISHVELSCRDAVSVEGGANVRASIDSVSRIRCRGAGTVTRLGRVDKRFVDDRGRGVAGVEIRDAKGAVLASTNEAGKVEPLIALETVTCPQRSLVAAKLQATFGSWVEPLTLAARSAQVLVVPTESARPDQ